MNCVDAAGLEIGDGHPPRIMGVLNVSEESPYDPSVYDDPGEAAAYVDEELIGEGADIVDVGLESANKRFEVLSAEEELERLDIALETIESVSGDAVFSIETRYSTVADEALANGFDMVNDICGFADPDMPVVCEDYDAAVAKMASPPDLERPGAVEETDWASRKSPAWAAGADYVEMVYEALKQNGLTEKTIVDPAFGGWSEAKTLEDDRETFRRLREFRALGRPMLISINRKNFLGELVDRETTRRLPASLAATSMAVERGAHVIRTHDVEETADAAAIGAAFGERSTTVVDGGDGSADHDGNEHRTNRTDEYPITITTLDAGSARELEAKLAEYGAGDRIDETIHRSVEIDGLTRQERSILESVVAESGGVCVSVGRKSLLVAGSNKNVTAVSRQLRDGRGRLERVGDALSRTVR